MTRGKTSTEDRFIEQPVNFNNWSQIESRYFTKGT